MYLITSSTFWNCKDYLNRTGMYGYCIWWRMVHYTVTEVPDAIAMCMIMYLVFPVVEINATCCRVVPFDSTHSLLEAPASLAGEEEKLGPSPYASSSSSVNTHHSVGSELLQLQRRITFAEGIEVRRESSLWSLRHTWVQICIRKSSWLNKLSGAEFASVIDHPSMTGIPYQQFINGRATSVTFC